MTVFLKHRWIYDTKNPYGHYDELWVFNCHNKKIRYIKDIVYRLNKTYSFNSVSMGCLSNQNTFFEL